MEKKRLVLKTDKPVQENFLGAGAIYHCYSRLPDRTAEVYTEEECAIEVDRVKKCGLKIARTFFRWYGWDKEKQCWDWDNEPYIKGFYKWAKDMQDIGTDIALNIGWWCPDDIMGKGPNGVTPFNKDDNWENSVQNYAEWVSEVAHQLIEVRGFTNIKYFFLFTEPGGAIHRFNIPEKTAYERWGYCARAAHNQLVKDNRRHLVKLVGPNEGAGNTSLMLKWSGENCDDVLDIYSSHFYLCDLRVLPEDIHSGKSALKLNQSIHRRGQSKVQLKPDTEYEISVWLKIHSTSCYKISGDFILGLFAPEEGFEFFHADTETDTRLNPESVTTIDESLLTKKWQKFTVKVYNKNATEGLFGFISLVNEADGVVAVDDFSLKEVGSDVEMLVDGGFENFDNIDGGWAIVGSDVVIQNYDTYYSWLKWAKTGMGYVPEGKPYWFDEYNKQTERMFQLSTEDTNNYMHDTTRGVELAVANNAFLNAGVQSSLLWSLFDQKWPDNRCHDINNYYYGDHRWGIMPNLKRTKVPYPAYYAFTLISRYLGGGEGTKVYSGEGEAELHSSAVESPDGDVTILVSNKRRDFAEFELDLGKFSGKTFYKRMYSPWDVLPNAEAELIKISECFEDTQNGLSDTLPPISFAVYTTRMD